MPIRLPFIPSVGRYRFGTDIGRRALVFDARWNARASAWYFDLLDQDLKAIALGLKIALGRYIGRRVSHPFFRDGVLVARDTSGQGREATFDDMGTRVVVEYFTSLEVSTILKEIRARQLRGV